MRLLVIGFDGATFDILLPLAQQGRLPNFSRLLQEGAWGYLRSTIPPFSPSAWRTFATGKNPGQHGVYDFQSWQSDYTRKPRPAQWSRHKTIWRLLSEEGRKVISVDVPFTYPPEPINGLMISGYPTPRQPGTIFTYPPDLPAGLKQNGVSLELGWPKARIDVHPDFFRAWEDLMQERKRLLDYLLHTHSWDLFAVVFGITDTLAHTLWNYAEPAHPAYHADHAEEYRQAFFYAYEQCDHILGHLWNKIDKETRLLVVSDHGFGTIRPPQWILRFLADQGWLHFRQQLGLRSVLEPIRKMTLQAYMEMGWLRRRIRELRPGSKSALKHFVARSGLAPGFNNIDYYKSLALPGDVGTNIYLNRRDRFTHGWLSDSEARQYAKTIREALLKCQDSIDGEPVIQAVYLRDDIYTGEAAAEAPDLVLEYTNRYSPGKTEAIVNPSLEGGHVPEGILLAWGAGIQAKHIPRTDIVNIAPTILYLLGEAIPPDMDGQVVNTLLKSEWLNAHPVLISKEVAMTNDTGQNRYTDEEEKEIIERLRALGYIE